MPKKFEVDETVYAKWPGSTQYFKATIVSTEDNGIKVKFESDESVETILKKHIMVNFYFYFLS